jgi:CRP/FNR family transcriptional regulator, cyclic AMP receptor protein
MPNYINVLRQTDILYGMTPTQLEMVGKLCQERSYHAGEIIFPEGTSSDELFIIMQGEVEIVVKPELINESSAKVQTTPIATLRRGQSFGEVALVDRGLRSATALASQNDTRLLAVPSDQLLQLCENYPQFGYRLMLNLAADLALKIRSTNSLIRSERLSRNKQSQNFPT